MNITEIIVKLAGPEDPGRPRLLAYASVVFDDQLAVHDLKVIEGRNGLFVAMPSKPAPVRCPCGRKTVPQDRGEPVYAKRGDAYVLLGKNCPSCQAPLPAPEPGRRFLDIAHPIRHSFRSEVEQAVLAEFEQVKSRSATPAPPPS